MAEIFYTPAPAPQDLKGLPVYINRELVRIGLRVAEALGAIESSIVIPADLVDLDDVVLDSPPTDEDVLTYDSVTGNWINAAIPATDLSGYLPLTGGSLSGPLDVDGEIEVVNTAGSLEYSEIRANNPNLGGIRLYSQNFYNFVTLNGIGAIKADGSNGAAWFILVTDATGDASALQLNHGAGNAIRLVTTNTGSDLSGAIVVKAGTGTAATASLDVAGNIEGNAYSANGNAGVTTTFVNGDGHTVTTTNGIVTGVGTTLAEQEVRWDDLRFPATAINPPGQASDPDVEATSGLLLFAGSGTEVIYAFVQMPHTWKEESEIVPHVHWQKSTSATGNVLWRMRYKFARVNEVMDASWSTAVDITSTVGGTPDTDTADKHLISSFGKTIDMTGSAISDCILFELSRIGSSGADTYGADARLLEFDIHYQIDSHGSVGEFDKDGV